MQDFSQTLSSLATELKTRNELDKRLMNVLERRLKVQDRLIFVLVLSIITLAGARVAEIVGLIP